MTPEQKARVGIDALLVQAGWHVCNVANANIHAAVGVATTQKFAPLGLLREVPVLLPPLAEQSRIVAEVEAEVDTNLKRAQALRQATLAKAFAGDQ